MTKTKLGATNKSRFWNQVFDIDELVVTLENISADDKRPLESYSVEEVISEAKYVLSTFFEAGHINGDTLAGEYEDNIDEFKPATPTAMGTQAWARSEVRKLKALIAKYGKVAA
jgi:hypothetical protein